MLSQLRSVAEARGGVVSAPASAVCPRVGGAKCLPSGVSRIQTRSMTTKLGGANVRRKAKVSASARVVAYDRASSAKVSSHLPSSRRNYASSSSDSLGSRKDSQQTNSPIKSGKTPDFSNPSANSPNTSANSQSSAQGAAKKTGTASTLSNLENLYAAFAKQQKEKAKTMEQKPRAPSGQAKGAVASTLAPQLKQTTDEASSPTLGATAAPEKADLDKLEVWIAPTSAEELEEAYLDAAARIEVNEGVITADGHSEFMSMFSPQTEKYRLAREQELGRDLRKEEALAEMEVALGEEAEEELGGELEEEFEGEGEGEEFLQEYEGQEEDEEAGNMLAEEDVEETDEMEHPHDMESPFADGDALAEGKDWDGAAKRASNPSSSREYNIERKKRMVLALVNAKIAEDDREPFDEEDPELIEEMDVERLLFADGTTGVPESVLTPAQRRQEYLKENELGDFVSAEDYKRLKRGQKVRKDSYQPGEDFLGVAATRSRKKTLETLGRPDRESGMIESHEGVGGYIRDKDEDELEAASSPDPDYIRQKAEEARTYATTFADLRAIDEEELIALGELDPMSPEALEMKRRNQTIDPRSEMEANMIEQALIERHRAAVEQVSQIEKDLDISSTVDGMAPLTHSQNPYLYNEAYALGLTTTELEWLSEREAWQELVDAKHTAIALQQRDMKEDRELVDTLFINVVNRLSEGPMSSTYIHPDDIKAQHEALEARKRLQTKLWEIYRNSPAQWAALLHKYLPSTVEKQMAASVYDREFWTPSNPWLLTAFTKQLVEEAEYMEKMIGNDAMDEEIEQRLLDQGLMRDDIVSDDFALGPLGQHSGISAEESVQAINEEDEKSQHIGCLFCSVHRHRFPLEPMNIPLLARHMTTSGTIMPRSATGLCKRHQAKMAKTIKQARHLNLFSYKKSMYRINDVFKPVSTWTTPDLDNLPYVAPGDLVPPTSEVDLYDAENEFLERNHMTMDQIYEFGANPVDAEERGDYDHMSEEDIEAATFEDALEDGEEREDLTEALNRHSVDHALIASIEQHASRQAAERARLIAEEIIQPESVDIMNPGDDTANMIAANSAALEVLRERAMQYMPKDLRQQQLQKQNNQYNKAMGKRAPIQDTKPVTYGVTRDLEDLDYFDDDHDEIPRDSSSSIGADMVATAVSKTNRKARSNAGTRKFNDKDSL